MQFFFNLLTHLLIIIGIISMLIFIFKLISKEYDRDHREGFILLATVMFSLFVYFAAVGFNLSIPDLLFDAMRSTDYASFSLLLGSAISMAVGTILAWYIIIQIKKHDVFAMRTATMFSVFMLLLFGEVYFKALGETTSSAFNQALLPNVSFVIGMLGYIIFNYKPS